MLAIIGCFFVLISGLMFGANQKMLPPTEMDTSADSESVDRPQSKQPASLLENTPLYSGVQAPLGVNETAFLQQSDSFLIGNGTAGYGDQNISLYLDDTHGWEANYFNASISEITDERDWIQNGGFGVTENLTANDTILDDYDNYSPNNIDDGLSPDLENPDYIISHDSDYIRVHFLEFGMRYTYDFLCLYDQNNQSLVNYTSTSKPDFYTPWFNSTEIKFTFDTAVDSQRSLGYHIDYYEVYNGSIWDSWKPHVNFTIWGDRLHASTDNSSGRAAVYTQIEGRDFLDGSFAYYPFDESSFVQNLSIPRGQVIDAWLSSDIYMANGISSNDFDVFFKINGQIVFTRGFGHITGLGKNQWHEIAPVNMQLWENVTPVFPPALNQEAINISVGIRFVGTVGTGFTSFEDLDIQKVYFDNIKLILKTQTNGTQNFVNLSLDYKTVSDIVNGWGESTIQLWKNWLDDPVNITLRTNGTKIGLNTLSQIYAYHLANTYATEFGSQGVYLNILSDGRIEWEFYHDVFIPLYYHDFAVNIEKPLWWNISSVEDPTGISTPFEGGHWYDNFVFVNSSFAVYPNWWYFKANSSNLLARDSTSLWTDQGWQDLASMITPIIYDIGDNISIQTLLDTSKGPIPDLANTWGNLTVYHPNGTIWWVEQIHPDGNLFSFTNRTIGGANTTGGFYEFKIVWTNGTSAGGVNGTFEIRHHIDYELLYPRDAIFDLDTNAIYGDILALQVYLNDSGNGFDLTNAIVTVDWPTGLKTLSNSSKGLYDTTLDTLDLGGPGQYIVEVNASKEGYYNRTLELKIQLVSETNLQVTDVDPLVELGQNISMILKYQSDVDSSGITGALIQVNFTATDYFVQPGGSEGIYLVEISTENLPAAGPYDVRINASRQDYENQTIYTRVQIQPLAVYMKLFMEQGDITLNKSYHAKIHRDLSFTVQVFTSHGNDLVTGGSVKLADDEGFSLTLTSLGNGFTGTIKTADLGLGIFYLAVVFEKPDYQIASTVVQVGVGRLDLRPTFHETKPQIVQNPGTNFSATIFLVDDVSGASIIGAEVTYAWAFGTGYFIELGDGYYTFNGTVPSQKGNYPITITIQSGAFYEVTSMELTIISEEIGGGGTQNIWYMVLGIAGAFVLVAIFSIVRRVHHIKQERAFNELQEMTSFYYDAHNIVGYIVLYKIGGQAIFDQWQDTASAHLEANLLSGFLTAITSFGDQMTPTTDLEGLRDEKHKQKTKKGEYKALFMDYANFKIFILDGHFARIAVIFSEQPSDYFEARLKQFLVEFEDIYGFFLEEFDGSTDPYKKADELFDRFVHFDLTRPIEIAESTKAKKLQTVGTLTSEEDRMLRVLRTFLTDTDYVRLRTVMKLYQDGSEDEELNAARGLVGLWLKGLLAPVDPETVLARAEKFFSKEDALILSMVDRGMRDPEVMAQDLGVQVSSIEVKLQSLRAWKLVDLKNQITEKGKTLLARKLSLSSESHHN